MKLLHKKSGNLHEAVIELVEDDDWEVIRKNEKFDFKWIREKNQIVHKIRLAVEEEILGLISIEDIPNEFRIHVRLIEVNSENRGKHKKYDHVAGCLFAFTCRLAFKKKYEGYVSMHPKTELIEHYKNKYGFRGFGINLYTELTNSESLIKKYLDNG
jgi:hypothetical protein